MKESDRIHVMPTEDIVPHESLATCWCQPEPLEICPACSDDFVGTPGNRRC